MDANTRKKISQYVLSEANECRDDDGVLDFSLTMIEEDVRIEFDLSDKEFEDEDISFLIWVTLDNAQMVPPDLGLY